VQDGARTNRQHDQFFANTTGGTGVMRVLVSTESAATLKFASAGKEFAHFVVEPGEWTEIPFEIPKEFQGPRITLDVTTEGFFTSFHYWFGTAAPTQ